MPDFITINGSKIELIAGDITTQHVDAIVNAANTSLSGGGGVDGAIHRAGGAEIMAECREIGICPTGRAVITTAGKLPSSWVIHTPGPVWRGGEKHEDVLLADCYRSCLDLAIKNDIKSIAFPSISTGVFGYPVEKAAKVALEVCCEFLQKEQRVTIIKFVLFDERTFTAYKNVLKEISSRA